MVPGRALPGGCRLRGTVGGHGPGRAGAGAGLWAGWWLSAWAWLTVAGGIVQGQSLPEWRWSHPEPHGNNVADLVFRSGWFVQVTDHGGIYTSTNRLIWEKRASGTNRDLRGAAYLGNRLLVVGENGTALWSDDAVTFQAATVTPATTDWFEGVAASATRALAVGDNGTLYQTTNGLAWTRVTGTSITNWLSGVTYGAGLFVAVGELGFIATSATGTNAWTRRASGTTVNLTRAMFGDSRVGADVRFLVTGENGLALGSNNGTTWSLDGSTGMTSGLLAGAVGVGERVAAGEEAVLLRKSGSGWADQLSEVLTPSPAPAWTYAAAAYDGARFVLAGRTGVTVESWRTNSGALAGQTFWFRNDDSPRNWLWEVHRFEGTYIAVGDRGTVLTSLSGVDWALEAVPLVEETVLYGIGGSPELAVAVGAGGTILTSAATYTNLVVRQSLNVGGRSLDFGWTNRLSLLGLTWEAVPSGTTNALQGIGWNGSLYVAVGGNGTVLRSADARQWARTTIPGAGFLSSVSPMNGGWVASGATGAVYTSTDAVGWTKRPTGTTQWIYRVRSVDGELVAVGQNGTLLTSTNGVAWTPRVSGTSSWLTDAHKVANRWYVSGTQGTILQSDDRVSWTAVPTITGKALYGLSSSGGQLVVSGAEGVILRSLVEPTLNPVAILCYEHLADGTPVVDVFGFRGTPEQTFRLESGGDLGAWVTETDATLDVGGSAIFGRVAAETRRFYRTKSPP